VGTDSPTDSETERTLKVETLQRKLESEEKKLVQSCPNEYQHEPKVSL